MAELKFKVPSKQAPGYFKRVKKAKAFLINLNSPDPDDVDKCIDFLADFVTQPASRDKAVELLWDASEETFEQLLTAISGGDEEDF